MLGHKLNIHKNRFEVIALAARSKAEELKSQIDEFKPRFAALANETEAMNLKKLVSGVEIRAGNIGVASLCEIEDVDIVL